MNDSMFSVPGQYIPLKILKQPKRKNAWRAVSTVFGWD